jgi:hypothetical protein
MRILVWLITSTLLLGGNIFAQREVFISQNVTTATNSFTYVGGLLALQGTPAAAVVATYSPVAGHSVNVGAYVCANAGCTTSPSGLTVGIKDNLHTPETCFSLSPGSPFIPLNSGGFTVKWNWWACPSIPSGVTSISVTSSPNFSIAAMWVVEVTGMAASSVFDGDGCAINSGTVTTGTVKVSSSVGCVTSQVAQATTHANDLIVAMIDNDNDESQSGFGVGWTKRFCDVSGNGCIQTRPVSVTGNYSATASWTGADTLESYIVAIKGSP